MQLAFIFFEPKTGITLRFSPWAVSLKLSCFFASRLLINVLILSFLFATSVAHAAPAHSWQHKIDQLSIGKTSIAELKKILATQSQSKLQKLSTWQATALNPNMYSLIDPKNELPLSEKNNTQRHFYDLTYPMLGFTFSFFDRPSQLRAIEVNKPTIQFENIRVGMSLNSVEKRLKDGEWSTTEGDLFWTLEYEKIGLRFNFKRDLTVPQFPMQLVKNPRVVSIEKYDVATVFVGDALTDPTTEAEPAAVIAPSNSSIN